MGAVGLRKAERSSIRVGRSLGALKQPTQII